MSLSETSIRERGTKMIYISDIYTTAPTDDRVATEKKVYQILDKLKISYERVDNDVVETMEECEEVDKALGTEIRKSIFLCNKKKTSFFLMEEHLGTKPGSASVMGLINDEDDYVQLIVDKEVAQEEWFGCNPGINTSHLKMKTEDLLNKFLPQIRHKAKIMEL